MLAHTKKRPIELRFLGPAENKDKAISALQSLGFCDLSGSIPWRDAFPQDLIENKSGTNLAGARYKEGLTQMQLSKATGIPQRHISEMERGKRPIGRKNAKLFSTVLNIDYRLFL